MLHTTVIYARKGSPFTREYWESYCLNTLGLVFYRNTGHQHPSRQHLQSFVPNYSRHMLKKSMSCCQSCMR